MYEMIICLFSNGRGSCFQTGRLHATTTVLRVLLPVVLLSWSCTAVNGPIGPFSPFFENEYFHCKPGVHNPYCPPKHGEYPAPIRPPVWLKPYLTAAPNYTGLHNDLQRLLEVRHREKWVTLFQYTLGQRDFFLNALYTYLKFGDANFYIVATVTDEAFEDCVAMQLPCYNATSHYLDVAHVSQLHMDGEEVKSRLHKHEDGHHKSHDFGTVPHMQLTWMNIQLGLAILELGYNFQHSDVDVGFMAKVLPSMRLLDRMNADLAMLQLVRQKNELNPANSFVLANPRTIALFKAYLGLVGKVRNNEVAINSPQLNTSFTRCRTKEACANVTASGAAALLVLPLQFNVSSCHMPFWHDGACSSRRLFLHSLCSQGRPWKVWSLKASGLWFLTDFSGNEVNASAGLGPTLPCAAPDDVAWHKPLEEYGLYWYPGYQY